MGKLVRLIGSGIGAGIDLASEAISSARNKQSNISEHDTPSRDLTIDQSSEFVFTDEKAAGTLVSGGYAELPAESHIHQHYAELPAGSEALLYGQYAELPAGDEPSLPQNSQLPAIPAKLENEPYASIQTIHRESSDRPTLSDGNEQVYSQDPHRSVIPENLHIQTAAGNDTIYHQDIHLHAVPEKLTIQPTVGCETFHNTNMVNPANSEKMYSQYLEDQYPGLDKEIRPSRGTERDLDVYSESNYSIDLDREIDQTEQVWKLDETTQRDLPPNYEEFPHGVTYANEINHAQECEDMIRELAQMARPANSTHRIPCPVAIPQRRPGYKYRGFVRAYAPVLAGCGISSDLFLEFLEDFYQASQASEWLDVVSIAADIGDRNKAAYITDHVVQVVAGTIASRDRANTFLGRVNQEILMPRGLYAMVVEFKDEVPSQDQGPLSLLSLKLRKTLFAAESIAISQLASNSNTNTGHPHGRIQLPKVAPLEFPDLDQEAKVTESAMAAPKSKHTSLVSRYQQHKQSCDNGKLITMLSGGRLGTKPGLIERATTSIKNSEYVNTSRISGSTGDKSGNKSSLIGLAANSFMEHRNTKRIRDESSRCGIKEQWQKNRGVKSPDHATKALQRNVQYLMIVNTPTQEEMEQSLYQLDLLVQQAGPRAARGRRS